MQVTNDGATILKAIGVDNPAAKILVGIKCQYFALLFVWIFIGYNKNRYLYFKSHPDISKVQDNEVGDGTTSVTVLAAELLRVYLFVSSKGLYKGELLFSCNTFRKQRC